MPTLTLALNGATLLLTINGQTFKLVTTASDFAITGATGTVPSLPTSGKINLQYHETYEKAIPLGTPAEVLNSLESILSQTGTSLSGQWASVKTQIEGIPILGGAVDTALDTSVRITDIGIELSANPGTSGSATYSGKFTLGLMFTPAVSHPIKLFNAEVTAFGAVVSVGLTGITLGS